MYIVRAHKHVSTQAKQQTHTAQECFKFYLCEGITAMNSCVRNDSNIQKYCAYTIQGS